MVRWVEMACSAILVPCIMYIEYYIYMRYCEINILSYAIDVFKKVNQIKYYVLFSDLCITIFSQIDLTYTCK